MLVLCDVGGFCFWIQTIIRNDDDDEAVDPIDVASKSHKKALAIQNEASGHNLPREWVADVLEQYSVFSFRSTWSCHTIKWK